MAFAVVEFRAQDSAGNFLTDVDVEVREETGGLPLVQLYSDRDGASPIGNPANFADGIVRFYLAGGSYKIDVSKDGNLVAEPFRNWAVGLLGEEDEFPATPTASEISYTDGNSPADVTDVQTAINRRVTGPSASVTDSRPVLFDGTTGLLVKQHTSLLGTAAAKDTGTSGDAVPLLNGVNTWSGAQVWPNGCSFSLSEDSANSGPDLTLTRISASPAANDFTGRLLFNGRDSAGNTDAYAVMTTKIIDPTSTLEDGEINFWTVIAGTLAQRWNIGAGIYAQGVTGGDHGAGTVNATAVYDDNVLLTCMALAPEFLNENRVDLAKWDDKVPDRINPETRSLSLDTKTGKISEVIVAPERVEKREHNTARVFKDLLDGGLNPKDPASLATYIRANNALPGMPTEAEWQQGKFSIGELHSRMWLATEIVAVAFMALADDVAAMKAASKPV